MKIRQQSWGNYIRMPVCRSSSEQSRAREEEVGFKSCASTKPMEARVDSEAVGAAATERALTSDKPKSWPAVTGPRSSTGNQQVR